MLNLQTTKRAVFSPLLLNLYINDVPKNNTSLVLYADDTAIIATSTKESMVIKYTNVIWII